jgi:hypothetical protein
LIKNHEAVLGIARDIMQQRRTNLWPLYGFWALPGDYDQKASDRALAPLEPFMLYPEGGRRSLWLPGWEERSVWGFDPQTDVYFAQLWRDPASVGTGPDIWILGRGTFEGRPFAVTTARILAQEIAVATGAELAAVCKAMLGIEP